MKPALNDARPVGTQALPTPAAWVCLHSLGWLAFGNAVGVLLAVLLVFPGFGATIAPLSYGRWIPVHLNAQLYGWCSLPMIGLLFRLYLPPGGFGRWPEWALGAWSGALVFACVGWLTGHSSGKLFMEWSGPSLVAMVAGMLFLGGVLAGGHVRRASLDKGRLRPVRWVLLAALLCIPVVFYWSANPALYPPVNPDSGGATGGSLLGSTLVVIAILWSLPLIVALPVAGRRGVIVQTLALLVAHVAWFGALDHGHRSHHEASQVVALCSLPAWWPVLVRYFRVFRWPEGTRPWLLAFCGWGAFLLATATLTFLPGVLERWKFTNALVGHVHAAMGGMLTSFGMLVLLTINPDPVLRGVLSARAPFIFWNAGCLAHVVILTVAGTIESADPRRLFLPDAGADVLYGLRLLAGLLMFMASAWWFGRMPAPDGTPGAMRRAA